MATQDGMWCLTRDIYGSDWAYRDTRWHHTARQRHTPRVVAVAVTTRDCRPTDL